MLFKQADFQLYVVPFTYTFPFPVLRSSKA